MPSFSFQPEGDGHIIQALPRRAMLLALGATPAEMSALSALSAGPAGDDLARGARLWLGGMALDLISLEMRSTQQPIDVTAFGDASPVYRAGLRQMSFHITAYATAGLYSLAVTGDPLLFDEVIGDIRVTAHLIVTGLDVRHAVNSLAIAEIDAVATGPVRIEPIGSEPARPAAAGEAFDHRRAMKLEDSDG